MSNYVIDENNNKVLAYSAEEVISVLEQAIADGSLKNVVAGQAVIDQLKCCVTGATNKIAFVTQAKYNELVATGKTVPNAYYYIIDDTTADDMDTALQTLSDAITAKDNELETINEKVKKIENGETQVGDAKTVNGMAFTLHGNVLKNGDLIIPQNKEELHDAGIVVMDTANYKEITLPINVVSYGKIEIVFIKTENGTEYYKYSVLNIGYINSKGYYMFSNNEFSGYIKIENTKLLYIKAATSASGGTIKKIRVVIE